MRYDAEQPGRDHGPLTRLNGVEYELAMTDSMEMDPIFGPQPVYRWTVRGTKITALPHVDRVLDNLWSEAVEFWEADSRMGDPFP